MAKTVQEHIDDRVRQFMSLSVSRQRRLRRMAAALIESQPHAADNSTFWRGLSARQVISACG